MRLRLIAEGTLDNVGHITLDVAGLVPGVGEPADFTNALWYAKKGDYLNSGFSLLSMIPELGDLVGKSAKYLGKSGKYAQKFISRYGPKIQEVWPEIIKKVEKIKDWEPFTRDITQALDEFLRKSRNGDVTN